jgi:nitrite reductase (NO-forming)
MDVTLSDRTKLMLVWPVAGFCVVIAFGVGLISMAAFDSSPAAVASTVESQGEVIEVELGDLYIKPNSLSAPAGVPLTFEVTNEGGSEHNFAIEGGPATDMIPPGESATLQVGSQEAGESRSSARSPDTQEGG